MPLFKITTDDGQNRISSDPEDLVEFGDADAAIKDAQVALAELAHDALPDGEAARFSVEVADEDGKVIYRAKMDFKASGGDQVDAGDPSNDVANQLAKGPCE